MASINLPYVKRYKDRHGVVRHYFRRKGFPSVALPGEVGSEAFNDAYAAALASPSREPPRRAAPGTVSAVLVAYYASQEWANLKPQTQANYRNILERFRADYGDRRAKGLTRDHVANMIAKRRDKPGATRNLIKRLRAAFDVGVARNIIPSNPFIGAKLPKEGSGFEPWTEADIDAFLKHWGPGTRARLALHLLLYTGQRRSDVVRMGRQHVRDGFITVTQAKTGTRLEIAIHPRLQAELDALPASDLMFLMTAYGKPMTQAGFSQWFVECAREAGLPKGRSPHGLRKAAARRLAEAGCTAHEIAAITGHASLKEIERYTRDAERRRLSEQAIGKLK